MPTYPTDPETHPANASFFAQLVEDASQMAPAAFTEVALALDRWNRFAEASALTLPTLIVWGDQDQIVSREATTRTLIAIPGAANLEVLRGVGHSPLIEDPLRLAERIIDFVSEDFAGFDAIRSMVEDDEDS
ncbi:MAG: alpha/beta hydrolase [Caldilineaceae bacterium]|nr:alpha/beta hydrolase [Caldilineaceae bacterium]